MPGNVVSTFYLSSPIHVDYKEVPSEPPYLLVVTFSATTSSMARWIEILNNRSEVSALHWYSEHSSQSRSATPNFDPR